MKFMVKRKRIMKEGCIVNTPETINESKKTF